MGHKVAIGVIALLGLVGLVHSCSVEADCDGAVIRDIWGQPKCIEVNDDSR